MKRQYMFAVQVTVDDDQNMNEASIARNLMHWLDGSPFQIDSVQPIDRIKIYDPVEKTTNERLSLLDTPMAVTTPEVMRERIIALREIGFTGDYSELLDEICQRTGITLSYDQKKEILK